MFDPANPVPALFNNGRKLYFGYILLQRSQFFWFRKSVFPGTVVFVAVAVCCGVALLPPLMVLVVTCLFLKSFKEDLSLYM